MSSSKKQIPSIRHYCHNKLDGSALPTPQPLFRRRAFSRISMTLFAEQSDDESSPSVSPLALSIHESLEDLVNKEMQTERETKQRFLVVLSVSGGGDSVALLHATMELCQKSLGKNWELDCRVVHFHHRQRDQEADLDCQLVQELAQEEYKIPFVLYDWNDEEQGEDNVGTSKFTQDRARQWRRQRLLEYTQSSLQGMEETADESSAKPIGVILTAHHKDDSEESLLLKLLRGVHILNLSGMQAITTVQNDDANGNICILRPWLSQRKADLQDYLLSNNHTWREDASNSSPKYLRNRVRNELIPLLEDLSPNIHKRLEILEQQSYELQQDLEPRILAHLDQQKEVVGDGKGQESQRRQYIWRPHDDSDVGVASPLVESQALFRWLQEEMAKSCGTAVSYETLQRVLNQLRNYPNQLDWTMDLGGNYSLRRKGSQLSVVAPNSNLSSGDESNSRGREWKWCIMAESEDDSSSDTNHVNISLSLSIPAELVSSGLQFVETSLSDYSQLPNASKRFCPSWRTSPIKLGQFLRGQKVPLHERDATPILYMMTSVSAPQDSTVIVAVQVNGTWMIDADYFQAKDNDDKKGNTRLLVQLKPS